jgi:hypothetical protein
MFRRHFVEGVAFLTGEGLVLALQRPSSLAMVKAVPGRPPAHELMLPAIVFRVAAGAISSRLHSSTFDDPRMVATLF